MNEDKYEALRAKAEVLIEALPYIQRFNRRIIVVKYGGSAMLDESNNFSASIRHANIGMFRLAEK